MAQQYASGRSLAGLFTVVGLGLVWLTIAFSIPSEQELSANEALYSQRPVLTSKGPPPSEPTLDLSIPGVPSQAQIPADQHQPRLAGGVSSMAVPHDPREAQVAHLRCEAEIAQVCPNSPAGPGRKQCLENRAPKLSASCQLQLRERFVKWKEERSRLVMACQADVKRWCSSIKPGEGQILQCLHEHAQDLSDRCYETLPKGTVYFTR